MAPHSLRRINRLKCLGNYENYLEVGVAGGKTFNQLSFHSKTAVDPKFRFNTSDYINSSVQFYETASDSFFDQLTGDKKFDFIFLDGLHTYDQTYRDFCNTIVHSTDDALILIDDTLPSDRFSAIRNQDEAYRSRTMESMSASREWHGDVYKILILIRLFHPAFQYATITGPGNPQTLLWRADSKTGTRTHNKQAPFPIFNDMRYLYQIFSDLSKADYSWLQSNLDILQPCSEAQLFDYLEC